MRLAIADPPYPPRLTERHDRADGAPRVIARSRAQRWYGEGTRGHNDVPADNHPAAADWDDPAHHRRLLELLMDDFDGWAIATTLDGLDCYRPLPIPARTMIWHKPTAMRGSSRVASTCEAVIVYPPIDRRARGEGVTGQVPDLLVANAPQVGFPGAKPPVWTRWVLDALGYDPDVDEVVDLFPGSGSVAAAAAQGVLL